MHTITNKLETQQSVYQPQVMIHQWSCSSELWVLGMTSLVVQQFALMCCKMNVISIITSVVVDVIIVVNC